MIDPNAVYLCDSGAQYYDGTTDVTRTLHFGRPKPEEKHAYTLVLKGNIALDKAVFPKGTNGFAIDVLARQFLWVSEPRYNIRNRMARCTDNTNRNRASTTGTAQAMAWDRS